MDTKMDIKVEYSCKVCNKQYSSYKSLWNHNNKFHNEKVINCNKNVINCNKNVIKNYNNEDNKYCCKYCNKSFNIRQYRWSHEKTCKKKDQLITITKNEFDKMKKQLNNIIKNPKKQITNNNTTNNNNNGTIINNTLVKFGDLSYENVLNDTEVRKILGCNYRSLEESIKQVHFNKNHPEYNNIFITNMRDNIGYIFNGSKIEAVPKAEMLNNLLDMHMVEINIALEKNENKLKDYNIKKLEDFIEALNNQKTKFIDENENKTYSNYKLYKLEKIKLLVYNESDKKRLDELNNNDIVNLEIDIESSDEKSNI